jgi:hypothetical protein
MHMRQLTNHRFRSATAVSLHHNVVSNQRYASISSSSCLRSLRQLDVDVVPASVAVVVAVAAFAVAVAVAVVARSLEPLKLCCCSSCC